MVVVVTVCVRSLSLTVSRTVNLCLSSRGLPFCPGNSQAKSSPSKLWVRRKVKADLMNVLRPSGVKTMLTKLQKEGYWVFIYEELRALEGQGVPRNMWHSLSHRYSLSHNIELSLVKGFFFYDVNLRTDSINQTSDGQKSLHVGIAKMVKQKIIKMYNKLEILKCII